MSSLDFLLLCGELLIDPLIAREDEELARLVRANATLEELRKYMEENF